MPVAPLPSSVRSMPNRDRRRVSPLYASWKISVRSRMIISPFFLELVDAVASVRVATKQHERFASRENLFHRHAGDRERHPARIEIVTRAIEALRESPQQNLRPHLLVQRMRPSAISIFVDRF